MAAADCSYREALRELKQEIQEQFLSHFTLVVVPSQLWEIYEIKKGKRLSKGNLRMLLVGGSSFSVLPSQDPLLAFVEREQVSKS